MGVVGRGHTGNDVVSHVGGVEDEDDDLIGLAKIEVFGNVGVESDVPAAVEGRVVPLERASASARCLLGYGIGRRGERGGRKKEGGGRREEGGGRREEGGGRREEGGGRREEGGGRRGGGEEGRRGGGERRRGWMEESGR